MKAARRAGWRAAEKTRDQVTGWIVPLGVGRPDPRPAHPVGRTARPCPAGRRSDASRRAWTTRARASPRRATLERIHVERRTPGGPAGHEPPLEDTRVIAEDAPQYNATLVRREDYSAELASFWVKLDGEPAPFEAGQYMTAGVVRGWQALAAPVLGGVRAERRGHGGLRAVRAPDPRDPVHDAPVAAQGRGAHAAHRPERSVHAGARRPPDPPLRLHRDRDRAVHVDDPRDDARRGSRARR